MLLNEASDAAENEPPNGLKHGMLCVFEIGVAAHAELAALPAACGGASESTRGESLTSKWAIFELAPAVAAEVLQNDLHTCFMKEKTSFPLCGSFRTADSFTESSFQQRCNDQLPGL